MHMKVRDVMTSEVASVNGSTPFRDVAEIMIAHGVSAVPVVDGEGHVIGLVSEADLLRKEEFREQFYREGYRPPLRARLREAVGHGTVRTQERARGVTAAELMSAPAFTTRPYTSVVSAARLMSEHGVKRLPVVDDEDVLVGIISRHDLLKVLARGDADIAREIRDDVVGTCLWADLSGVEVSVENGVVTLTGSVGRRSQARVLTRMVERTNGVLGVADRLEWKEDDLGPWEGH
ncbi:CBS domain-containing protein [Microbispora cellulosiformans]|uniref:CBS domain-containing protein n=1 Tax=Microbispora cellulosiformans TaxID=2614688 RepID=A0A5J5K082_9ACTN|nr:CBS domain-containing protein [Microbispora cellulosiformans]KAA9377626.1 CBS domain-containing protein [Microbispora cellulosiformans]